MIQHFRAPLLNFLLSSASRTASRLLAEMTKYHKIFQSGLDHNHKFSLGPHKIISAPNHQEVDKKTMPIFPPPKRVMDACLCLECSLQVVMYNWQEKAKQRRLVSRVPVLKRKKGKCCKTMHLYTIKICHSY